MTRRAMKTAWTILLAAVPAAALAQPPARGSEAAGMVSGNGVAKVERPASLLRMHVQMVARGKTLEEALAKFKDRREATLAQLEKLGADQRTLAVKGPKLAPEGDPQRRMAVMVQQRMGKKAKAKLAAPPISVAGVVTAQWPLEGDSPEKLLLAVHAIQQKVKAIDMAGAKDTGTLTPEELEAAEETAEETAQAMQNMGEDTPRPGDPVFVYVAKIPAADRQKALAEAFAKAKADAQAVAKAAGIELGELVSLNGQGGNSTAYDNGPYGGYNRRAYMFMQQAAAMGEDTPDEAVGPDLDSLKFQFVVSATFAIKK